MSLREGDTGLLGGIHKVSSGKPSDLEKGDLAGGLGVGAGSLRGSGWALAVRGS